MRHWCPFETGTNDIIVLILFFKSVINIIVITSNPYFTNALLVTYWFKRTITTWEKATSFCHINPQNSWSLFCLHFHFKIILSTSCKCRIEFRKRPLECYSYKHCKNSKDYRNGEITNINHHFRIRYQLRQFLENIHERFMNQINKKCITIYSKIQ